MKCTRGVNYKSGADSLYTVCVCVCDVIYTDPSQSDMQYTTTIYLSMYS
jgi:hypothetical protein